MKGIPLLGAWRFFLLKAIDNADGDYPTISRLKILSRQELAGKFPLQ
jgi:hypothetical protein